MLKLIPNILTFGRLVLTVIFIIMLLYSPNAENQIRFLDIAFVIFVIAGLTDTIDGAIARKLNVASKMGRMMDPLADKVLVCGSFICFAIIGKPQIYDISLAIMSIIHWAVAAVIIFRELFVTILRHIAEAKGVNFAATVSGKIKMFLQSFAIGTVVMKMARVRGDWSNWFTIGIYVIMLTVTIISGLRATQRSSLKQQP